MKVSGVLCLSSLLSLAAAFGIRGAAERTLIFATYVMEEINTDTSLNKVAPDCAGTRDGLRGQKNRCTLKELCEHLWLQTEWDEPDGTTTKKVRDVRPNAGKTVWLEAVERGAAGLGDLNAVNMRDAIMGVRLRTGTDAAGNAIIEGLPKQGYYGNINVGNILDGATDYFEVMRQFGSYTWNTHQTIEANKGSLTPAVAKRFDTWYKHATDSASAVYYLRLSDHYNTRWKAVQAGLRKDYAVDDPKRKAIRIQKKVVITAAVSKVGNIQDIDIEKTIAVIKGPLGLSEDVLRNKINGILAAGAASEAGINHQAAIAAAKRSMNLAQTGVCS